MSTTIRTARPAQNIRLMGPDFIVRTAIPAQIVRSTKRAPLTAEEAEAFLIAGSEAEFYRIADALHVAVNTTLPETLS